MPSRLRRNGAYQCVIYLLATLSICWVMITIRNYGMKSSTTIASVVPSSSSLCSKEQKNILYRTHKPLRRFHSNHWFHLCEYYLSSRRSISIGSDANKIVIAVHEPQFLRDITSMTIFILLLTFSNEKMKEMSVLYAQHIQNSSSEKLIVTWTNDFNVYSYRNDSNYNNQYHNIGKNSQRRVVMSDCFVDKGNVGAIPIPSDEWFRDKDAVVSLRSKIEQLCPLQLHGIPGWMLNSSFYRQSFESKPHKMVIYQRDSNRYFDHLNSLTESLANELVLWKIGIIIHNEDIHPCLLYHALHDADVLLTTHGFQSIGQFKFYLKL